VNVLLVDDHALMREGLAYLLHPLAEDLHVREAGSAEEALGLLQEQGGADLVLMDIGLPGMSGLEAIALMHQRHPGVTVVALSSVADAATVLQALHAGALGFIPKSATSAELRRALTLVLQGGTYLPPQAFLGVTAARGHPAAAATAPVDGGTPRITTPEDLGLTPRQTEVLCCILQHGMVAKQIERHLGLSAGTVKAHTSAVLRALNVTTRTQAVVRAQEIGLRLPPPRRREASGP
jgi:DNA-binding NarL/FixJ family response regulator